MAKLPSAKDLGYRPAQTANPVYLNTPQAPIENSLSAVGETVGKIADTLQVQQDEQDKFNMLQAKSQVLQQSLAVNDKILQDGDYSTYAKRYTDEMNKVKQSALAMVKNPNARKYLELDIQNDIARGVSSLASKSLAMERDAGAAALNETLAKNKEAYLRATDDVTRNQLDKVSAGLLRNGQARGYIQDAKGTGRKIAEDWIESRALLMSPTQQAELLKPTSKDEKGNPIYGQTGTWVDKLPIEKRAKIYDSSLKELEAIARKGNEENILSQLKNQEQFTDLIYDQGIDDSQKILKINEADLKGQITNEFAAEARQYINSAEKVAAATDSRVEAEIITRMYDLNAMSETNEKDYLLGVQNLRQEIIRMRTEGKLSGNSETKLNNQIKTLMSNKISEATQSVVYSFRGANKIIESQLPPEYRGEATRKLFYETLDLEKASKDKDNKQDIEIQYNEKALKIIDGINKERRAKAIKNITNTDTPEETEKFLSSKGYTMDDVKETAKKYGLTEKQVIDSMKAR